MRILITVITINLLMLLAAHQAQAISPVKEAKTKDWLQTAMPVIKSAYACKWQEKHDFLQGAMDLAYTHAGAVDDMDKMIVDMWYTGIEMEFDYGGGDYSKAVKYIKANPNNADVIQQCEQLYNQVLDDMLFIINY